LSARLVEPNQAPNRHHFDVEDDEDAIFAELEAEIENDDNIAMREQGLETIKRECGTRFISQLAQVSICHVIGWRE